MLNLLPKPSRARQDGAVGIPLGAGPVDRAQATSQRMTQQKRPASAGSGIVKRIR